MVASMFIVSPPSVSWLCGSLRRPLLCCMFQGILSDDHGLAAALWRTFFNRKCEDPRHLELLVEYVRKQIQYLDSMNGEDLLLTGEVSWRPLVEKNPQSILKPHSPTYNDEGL
uniref:Uncharacterized protein DKFZp686O0680 n=1 Tax=Homo sapiens TaxID=9606 RepID=Q7Z3P9_HUMAN|nr:hypothetical protein [Homo sapiens]